MVPIDVQADGLDVDQLARLAAERFGGSGGAEENVDVETSIVKSNDEVTKNNSPISSSCSSTFAAENRTTTTTHVAGKNGGTFASSSTTDHLQEYRAMVYCIPSFHNPTGTVMSHAKRVKLVELARKWDLLVFCDDVYELLGSSNATNIFPPPRLLAYDACPQNDRGGLSTSTEQCGNNYEDTGFGNRPTSTAAGTGTGATATGARTRQPASACAPPSLLQRGRHVLSNSTFSKILGPGVRCGWIEGHRSLIARLSRGKATCSAGAGAQFVGALIERNLRSGRQAAFLQDVREEFDIRRNAVYRVFYAAAADRLRTTNRETAAPGGSRDAPGWFSSPSCPSIWNNRRTRRRTKPTFLE
ncbi:unnamed protein product [Amoebophrya sp. A25]|nr:unnamed protein product [Amoebophrya sp. A25]|eukprot:GSA25T00013256001.1